MDCFFRLEWFLLTIFHLENYASIIVIKYFANLYLNTLKLFHIYYLNGRQGQKGWKQSRLKANRRLSQRYQEGLIQQIGGTQTHHGKHQRNGS